MNYYYFFLNRLVDEGGDWERRNRLKVYEGVHEMWLRRFPSASKLFLDSVSTFTCTELLDFNTFVIYTVITSILSLERPELKKDVLESGDVHLVIKEIPPAIARYLTSLYDCQYKDFLVSLLDVMELMSNDRYLCGHINWYSREMRVKVYSQFLEAYRSVKLESMARKFGLSKEFLDQELSRFIAAQRLHCKIDKVNGFLEIVKMDDKNEKYQEFMKLGDGLLNRIQKLSKVTDL